MERQFSVAEAEASSELLACIEDGDVEEFHLLLSKLPEGTTSILNTPSLLARHKLRTPLMAAAATGDFPCFTAIQHAFDRQFPNKVRFDAVAHAHIAFCKPLHQFAGTVDNQLPNVGWISQFALFW